MNIMLVSQCSKQALPGTRRILDQFAERKGSRTWLTPITEIGLQTLHQLLRQRARRNTAVACHWVHGSKIELLWIVGNRKKFNREGNVPTDTRKHSVLNDIKEDKWKHTEGIALLASIAGLFHDFGKANQLFQRKLVDSKAPKSEPIRHEWLSVRLFQGFVENKTDEQWLGALANVQSESGEDWIKQSIQDGLSGKKSPLRALEGKPVALAVCWLILTHHRLPHTSEVGRASGSEVNTWPRKLAPEWNSPQFSANQHDPKTLEDLWRFKEGLPVNSKTWQKRAKQLAERALGYPDFLTVDWFQSTFVLHMARCALMLADHCYSAADTSERAMRWQDETYAAYANTRKNKSDGKSVLHQRLDEHCIGVAHYAFLFAKNFPRLRSLLPAIGDVRSLRKHSKGRFAWQNKAYSMAREVGHTSQEQGGFFVNMASTGTGKTIANARMAYGLSNEKDGCRFNVMLGLRTLTLQTGTVLQQRIGLGSSELATLVGSSVVRKLHDESHAEASGSVSGESIVDKNDLVYYEGEITQSKFGDWLGIQRSQTLLKLLSSPVLVSTIDYLMPATESARGGRQIAPMLRLLSSDIVLDEPDDFGLKDQPALCRLVYWSGMLGGRVILSSATLSPALLEALFSAYQHGRKEYQSAMYVSSSDAIVCGWVDEHGAASNQVASVEKFVDHHQRFVNKRIKKLQENPPRRLAALLPVVSAGTPQKAIAETVAAGVQSLHQAHGVADSKSGKKISVGLVRMANINPLVAVAQELALLDPPEDSDINICVYHARHPLLRRHLIEKNLDSLLNRSDESLIWKHPVIQPALKRKAKNQIFIVLATAVAEVGRDHCYDWAVVEPSSMRSIVQLAGRVFRHREPIALEHPNMLILENNFKALQGRPRCFERPGYESELFTLNSHTLQDCLPLRHYRHPAPLSCIREVEAPDVQQNMVDMEHAAMRAELLTNPYGSWPASLWWREPVRWTCQMQQNTRFRQGPPTELHALVTDELEGELQFKRFFNDEWNVVEGEFKWHKAKLNAGVYWWITLSDQLLLAEVATDDANLEWQCQSKLIVDLEKSTSEVPKRWNYHEVLGLFRSD